jgi:hypothetical protein
MEYYELKNRLSTAHSQSRIRDVTDPPSQLSYEPVYFEETETGTLANRNGSEEDLLRTDGFNGTKLQSFPRQVLWTWVIAVACGFWLAFTVTFALNCSMSKPFVMSLLPSRSETTLLILNVCSHGSLLLLTLVTSRAFESVRWALAASKRGIPFKSFLGLSRATSLFGVINLLLDGECNGFASIDGQKFWGIQRYISHKPHR